MPLPEGIAVTELAPEELLGPLNEVERKHAPRRLYVAGDQGIMEAGPRVSIVGTREPSRAGAEETARISGFLVSHGVVVVSGLALGVDTVAHEVAIREEGRTVAVLGTPLDQCTPKRNQRLQERIMWEHLAVSQFPLGSEVKRSNFPMRNRTMALVSHATVIVEATDASGTRHQGWEALRLGRPLFILERVAKDPRLTWPAQMREYGALVVSPSQLDEVLEALPATGAGLDVDAAF